MSDNSLGYSMQAADMWRLWGMCGMCKTDKPFLKRVIIKVMQGNAISPKHFCKKCRQTIIDKINVPK